MRKILSFVLVVILAGCASSKKAQTNRSTSSRLVADGKLFTALWQQRAAEYKALCFQAYNIAHLRLDEKLAQGNTNKPLAIVTDIDETFLDNSDNAVHQALQGKDFETNAWYEWTAKSSCDTLAGALSFFNYVASKGVEVFYITNRDEIERAGTLKNLQRYNFPFADNNHLQLRQGTSSKETRRQNVAATHEIFMLLGDNLADFSTLLDKKSEQERTANVQHHADEFGKRFIILPNPNYGDWEGALYKYNFKLSAQQKDSIIRSVLRNY